MSRKQTKAIHSSIQALSENDKTIDPGPFDPETINPGPFDPVPLTSNLAPFVAFSLRQ
jgi:hypothetical protein